MSLPPGLALLAAEGPFDLGRQICTAPEVCEEARAVRLVVCGNELARGKREHLALGGVVLGDRLGSVQNCSTVPVDSVDISHLGGPAGTPLNPARGLLTVTLQNSMRGAGPRSKVASKVSAKCGKINYVPSRR
jgi:hypothetical protein